ncbi:hypothetical protein MCUN1_001741 [Malassezia cuniculi]|uniref:Saccharopine dehydrogenase NADP binding domain-containing protein n=1 Tax=Malassezia cuniculi TaxID=948313 RepID=A0AAF0EQU8_9BASI|nr:hypothetical protein MCUN1_001741 [Malassezia cuniculi]
MLKYDVALYGATGFTGQIVAQYLATHPQQPRIAFAGRNTAKIQSVIDNLVQVSAERVKSIGIIEASSDDYASLQRLAEAASVIINTVGPYSLLGGYDVVRAAAESGTGYVDLNGESTFFAQLAADHSAKAKETQAVIVPSCGFDALPFDLTTFLAVQLLKKEGSITNAAALCGYSYQGGVSGGTIASILLKRDHPEELALASPYMLSPVEGESTLTNAVMALPQFNEYGFPTILSPHNARVVYRTSGLLQSEPSLDYGAGFSYNEAHIAPSKIHARLALVVVYIISWLVIHVRLLGIVLTYLIPQGTGPSLETRLKGSLDVRTLVKADGKQAVATMRGNYDPGYHLTAQFISEAALAIALDRGSLSPVARSGGIVTPATLGHALADRLNKYADVEVTAHRL